MTNVDYVLCIAGREFSYQFLTSWTNTIIMLEEEMKCTFMWSVKYAPIVSFTRNLIVGNAHESIYASSTHTKPLNNQVKFKKMLFLDDDMVWEPSEVKKLLLSGKDIVGAAYARSDGQTITASLVETPHEPLPADYLINKTQPFEVDHIGFGFVAVKYEVLQKMKFPWFDVITLDNGDIIGEDAYFCHKAREAGYKTYIDPSINVSHQKKMLLSLPR